MNSDELKAYIQLFITLLSEKQAAGIRAHVDVSDWTNALSKMISLIQKLESGELALMSRDTHDDFPARKIVNRLPNDVRMLPFPSAFNDTIKHGLGLVSIDPGESDQTVIDLFNANGLTSSQTLAEVIALHTGITYSVARQIVHSCKDKSLKEFVHVALKRYGLTLAVGGDRHKDTDWYANSVIDKVLPLVEKQLRLV